VNRHRKLSGATYYYLPAKNMLTTQAYPSMELRYRESVLINFVSRVSTSVWLRQQVAHGRYKWVYSQKPTIADIYVIYGLTEGLVFPSSRALKIFVTPEPPEIFTYDLGVLKKYDIVIAPCFPYLSQLSNVQYKSGLLNWSIGVPLWAKDSKVLSLSEITTQSQAGKEPRLTVILSKKRMTSFHKKRLAFLEFLGSKLNSFEVYGEGFNPVNDKASVLFANAYHLAVENSIHKKYWTEKVSDSILAGCQTFYVGDPDIGSVFSSKTVIPLNLYDFDESYRVISTTMEKGLPSDFQTRVELERQKLVDTYNVHTAVIDVLEEVKAFRSKIECSAFSEHSISLSENYRFLRYRIKRRFSKNFKK
jgi:hypothetical protein